MQDQHPQGADGVQVPTEGELLHWEGLVFLFQVSGEVQRKIVNGNSIKLGEDP